MHQYSIILASASPRRRKLLARLGIDFDVIPAHGEEQITSEDPVQVVRQLAGQKAAEVAGRVPGNPVLIIGADTIVVKDGQILGKPQDETDAYRMLRSLQGDVHQVYTGVCLILREREREQTVTFHEMTRVHFCPMTDVQIRAYIATGDPMDKAGAYGIQSGGGAYISRIEGDYDNVVGLPVERLQRELGRLGVRTQPAPAGRQKIPGYPAPEMSPGTRCPVQEAAGRKPGMKECLDVLSRAQASHVPRPPVPKRENAVLLSLIETDNGYDLLFEKRALHLKHQPGDICLPGGGIKEGETPREAAIRETQEELLIDREQIRILFPMDGLIGPGDRTVWPFAAVLSGYQGTFSADEVDHTFRIPLSWFLTHPPKVYTGRRTTVPQADFPYERIAGGRSYWKGGYEYDILVYDNEETAIWGITARVTDAFIKLYLGEAQGAPV